MHIKCIAYVIQTHYTVHYHCFPGGRPTVRTALIIKSCSSLNNVYIEYYPGVIKSNKTHISKLNMFNFVNLRGRICMRGLGRFHCIAWH